MSMSGTGIVVGQKVLHFWFLSFILLGCFAIHVPSADNVHSTFKKMFLKKKGASPTQSKLPTSQRTGDRYLDLSQVFVVKVLKGVNEVLLHLHVQGVFHLRELPHGLPHLTERRAWKGRTKLLYVTENRRRMRLHGQCPSQKKPHGP